MHIMSNRFNETSSKYQYGSLVVVIFHSSFCSVRSEHFPCIFFLRVFVRCIVKARYDRNNLPSSLQGPSLLRSSSRSTATSSSSTASSTTTATTTSASTTSVAVAVTVTTIFVLVPSTGMSSWVGQYLDIFFW